MLVLQKRPLLASLMLLGVLSVASTSFGFGRSQDCDGWSVYFTDTTGVLRDYCYCADVSLYLVTDEGDVLVETQTACQKLDGVAPQELLITGAWETELGSGTYYATLDVLGYVDCDQSGSVQVRNPDPRNPLPTFGPCAEPPPPPPPVDCDPRTPGYWKNHPEKWPVEALTIGDEDHEYSKECLIKVLNTDVRGDMRMQLIHHLISAKLNFLSCDESDETAVAECIDDADVYLLPSLPASGSCPARFFSGRAPSKAAKTLGELLKNCLDTFNNS